ncbi:MAG TPA: ABC transporter substrate-binding protein [Solirubrobacteraceae bacterium]|jgi:ABC-type nitrate/sulfonate/bicarbonate transport system substrate-binding protein
MKDNGIRRREFVKYGMAGAAALLPGVLAGCGGSSASGGGGGGGGDAITVQLGWLKDVEYAGFWLALHNGHYKRLGVNPTFLAGGPNIADIAPIIDSGRAHIGVDPNGMVDLVGSASKSGLVMFATIYQTNPAAIMSLPKNPVHSPQDLVGKKIGLQAGDSPILDAVFKINHLNGSYHSVPVGFSPEPLVQGACEAYYCFSYNQPITLREQGVDPIVTSFADLGFPAYADILFAKDSYLKSNRDTVTRFLHASILGWQDAKTQLGLSAQLSVDTYGKSLGLNLKQQTLQAKAQVPLLSSPSLADKGVMWVDPAEVSGPIYKALSASGTKSLPPVDQVVDTSILEAVYKGQKTLAS